MSLFLYIFSLSIILFQVLLIPSHTVHAIERNDSMTYQCQIKLHQLGYNPGPLDGLWGKKTKSAIMKFQRDHNLKITGKLDAETVSQLGIIDNSAMETNVHNQITPSETVGVCLESNTIFKEYQNDTNQFNKRFNEIPLCILGYASMIGERSDYFYINIIDNALDVSNPKSLYKLECRIEKLNELHRRILERSLIVNTNKKVQVKGIYQSNQNLFKQTLILDQCYPIHATDKSN